MGFKGAVTRLSELVADKITGAIVQTAASGVRVVIENDPLGGLLKFFGSTAGLGYHPGSFIMPNDSEIDLTSPTTPGNFVASIFKMTSGPPGFGGNIVEFDSNEFLVTGFYGPIACIGTMHSSNVLSDGNTGTDTLTVGDTALSPPTAAGLFFGATVLTVAGAAGQAVFTYPGGAFPAAPQAVFLMSRTRNIGARILTNANDHFTAELVSADTNGFLAAAATASVFFLVIV